MSVFRSPFQPAVRRHVLRSPFALRLPSAVAAITPVAFVAAGALGEAAAAPYQPPMPAGWAVGDFLLLVTATPNNTAIGTASQTFEGWLGAPGGPTFQGSENAAGATRQQDYFRIATSGQTAPTFDNGGDHQASMVLAFRNVDPAQPFDVVAVTTAASGTAVTFPSVTTRIPNAYVINVLVHAIDTNTAQASGWANAALTGYGEIADASTLLGVGGGLAAAGGTKATAGATGSSTATLATASAVSLLTLALRPAGSAPITGTPLATGTQFAEGATLMLPTATTIRYGSTPAQGGTQFVQAMFPPGDYGPVGNNLTDRGDPFPFNAKTATVI